ncbi:MAG: acyltransferase [Candidatus Hodarchaeota archaeon]
MKVPEGFKEIFKMFPVLKYTTYVTPFFVSEDDAETEKSKERIQQFQADLTKRIIQNTKRSIEGKGKKIRNLRLATEKELRHYENMHNIFLNQIRLRLRLRLLQWGTPKFKRNYLRDLGANVGEGVMITFGNLMEVIFPQFLSIGNDTVFGMGANVTCTQFFEDELYIGPINIGNNVLIGAGAAILPGVTIGDNSIITPGVVHYDVPPQTLCVGLPEDVRVPLEGKINLAAADAKRKVTKTGWDLHDWRQFMPASIILAKNFLLELQKFPMGQSLRQSLLRLAGIKVGKNVHIEDNVVFDAWFPEKITIEDGATVKRHSVIACHEGIPPTKTGEKGQFRVGEVTIGKNALVESGSGILPGVKVGDDAEVLPYTFIATDVKKGIQVVGIPSRKVGETFDIQNFMMQQFGYSATVWDEIREDQRREEMLKEELAEEMSYPSEIEEKAITESVEVIETAEPEASAIKEMKSEEIKKVEFEVVELDKDDKELKTKKVEFEIE